MSEGLFNRSSFVGAKLTGADMYRAIVPRSVFHGADLSAVNFDSAFIYRSRFEGADLSQVKGLTQAQLDSACGDDATKLPPGLTKPTRWPCGED
jgi:uncharacterized protein YjbI with pentapeptide repeats